MKESLKNISAGALVVAGYAVVTSSVGLMALIVTGEEPKGLGEAFSAGLVIEFCLLTLGGIGYGFRALARINLKD